MIFGIYLGPDSKFLSLILRAAITLQIHWLEQIVMCYVIFNFCELLGLCVILSSQFSNSSITNFLSFSFGAFYIACQSLDIFVLIWNDIVLCGNISICSYKTSLPIKRARRNLLVLDPLWLVLVLLQFQLTPYTFSSQSLLLWFPQQNKISLGWRNIKKFDLV